MQVQASKGNRSLPIKTAIGLLMFLIAVILAAWFLKSPTVRFHTHNDRRVIDRLNGIMAEEKFFDREECNWVGVGGVAGFELWGNHPPMTAKVLRRLEEDARRFGYPLQVTSKRFFGEQTILNIDESDEYEFRGRPFKID